MIKTIYVAKADLELRALESDYIIQEALPKIYDQIDRNIVIVEVNVLYIIL